jgi:hypothetical protein
MFSGAKEFQLIWRRAIRRELTPDLDGSLGVLLAIIRHLSSRNEASLVERGVVCSSKLLRADSWRQAFRLQQACRWSLLLHFDRMGHLSSDKESGRVPKEGVLDRLCVILEIQWAR